MEAEIELVWTCFKIQIIIESAKVTLSKCISSTQCRTVFVYYSLEMFSSSKDVTTVNFVALFTVVTDNLFPEIATSSSK